MTPDVRSRPLGVSVMPLENRREMLLHVATTAEALGYDAFVLPETWAYDITVLLAEIATRTRRIRVGSGVLGVWGRSAGTVAMAAATLHVISGGRFLLGLGASTPQLTEGLHDVPFNEPIKQMRRVLSQVRALLNGERTPLALVTGARPLRLNLPPAPELPIWLAGLAPETMRLAGELADAWLPFLYPYSRLTDGVALLKEGASRRPTPERVPDVCPLIPTAVADDAARAREGVAWFVAFYLTTMGPLYPKTLGRAGFGKEVEAVVAANPGRNPSVVPPEGEELLEQLTVFGTPEEARTRLARWYDAGVVLPTLLLRPGLTLEEVDFTLRAFR